MINFYNPIVKILIDTKLAFTSLYFYLHKVNSALFVMNSNGKFLFALISAMKNSRQSVSTDGGHLIIIEV